MAPEQDKTPIHSLTSTRAFAAILVFIHHVGGSVFPFVLFPALFHIGNIAVGYFFVLSGFVLYISYQGRKIDYINYLKKRIARILPIYLVALLLTIIAFVYYYDYKVLSDRGIAEIVLSGLCLQSFIPTYPLVLNFPGWSIGSELFFYMLFPAFLLLQTRYTGLFVVLTLLLYTVAQFVHLSFAPIKNTLSDNVVDFIYFNPLMHLSQFFFGMLGGYLFRKFTISIQQYRLLPFLFFVVVLAVIAFRPIHISFQVGLIAPLFMILILLTAKYNPKMLNIRPVVFLGEISYGLYILQHPVYTFLDHLNNSSIHLPSNLFFYASLCILIGVATITYYAIEIPFIKLAAGIKQTQYVSPQSGDE